VEPTHAGRLILAHAERVLAEVDALHGELEQLTGLLSGQLRIGGMYPTGRFDLFDVLAEFRAAYPGVAIHMVEGTQDDTLDALRADDLDCAFIALDPDSLDAEFDATMIWTDELVVALPVGHRLAACESVSFKQLASEDLISYRENSAMRRRLERKMAEAGVEPRNAFVCTEMAAVRALASKGLGVAVIPRSTAEEAGPAIELRPMAPEPLTWPVALVWRADRRQSAAGKAFLQVAREYAQQSGRPRLRAA
jgi:DNA-binding transcriptional LysR family regulator